VLDEAEYIGLSKFAPWTKPAETHLPVVDVPRLHVLGEGLSIHFQQSRRFPHIQKETVAKRGTHLCDQFVHHATLM
jgi:hypothetical protein